LFQGDSTGVEFMKYASSQIVYPIDALLKNIEGRVFVEFPILFRNLGVINKK